MDMISQDEPKSALFFLRFFLLQIGTKRRLISLITVGGAHDPAHLYFVRIILTWMMLFPKQNSRTSSVSVSSRSIADQYP